MLFVSAGRTRRPSMALRGAAALSMVAALIHLWVTPEHFGEWWGYGLFFLLAAVAQSLYAAALLLVPRWPIFLLGIAGNLAIILLWVVTRTLGIPLFGPEAGEVEGVGLLDLSATFTQLALVVVLAVLARDVSRGA